MKSNPSVKILIFDLDGTLVDSSSQILNALNEACSEADCRLISKELFATLLGLPINSIIAHLDLDSTSQLKLINSFRTKLKNSISESNTLYEGVEDFLVLSKALGFHLAIATSKPTYLAELVVANSPLSNYIDFIQGTEGFPAKPAPDVILRCLNHFDTKNGIMFGDRVEDIMSAVAVGIPSIGIAQGHHLIEEFIVAGAKLGFKNFLEAFREADQIWSLLTNLNRAIKN